MSPTSEHTNTVPCETHTPPTGRRALAPPAPRRTWFTGLVLGAVTAVTAFLLLPYGPDPDLTFEGDPELVTDLEAAVDPDLVQGLVTARFPVDDPDDVEWADGGTADGSAPVGPDTPFETASVFKAFTGMTLIDMVEKGETSLDRTLAEVFPEVDFADPAVAAATLEEVATHHAGLSAVPVGDDPGGILRGQVLGDLYRTSMPAREYLPRATAVAPGTFVYSNMGYAVLGEALAEESGTPYEELVRERVLDPLGMDDTVISGDGVPEGGAEPHVGPGARVEEWRNTDYAAAGISTWSTPADLVRFITAVTDGSAPGLAALEPVHPDVTGDVLTDQDIDDTGITSVGLGMGWFQWEYAGVGEMTWSSGGLPGVRTMIAMSEEEAVVVMANSFSVEAPVLAGELLSEAPERVDNGIAPLQGVLTSIGLIVPPLLLIALMARRRTLITQRRLDRLRVVSLSLGNVAWALYFLRMGAWTLVPPVFWAVSVGVVVVGVTVGLRHFRRVPVEAGRWRWLHVPVFVVSVMCSLVIGGAGLWGMLIAW